MDYRVFSASSGEEDSSTEAHVFARAYRAAWRSAYACDPVGRHRVDGLELIIDFGGDPAALDGTVQPHAGQQSRPALDPAPTVDSANVPTGDHHDQ
jgi:hypothetical protein